MFLLKIMLVITVIFGVIYTENVINLPSDSFTDSLINFQQETDFAKPYKDIINKYQDFSPYKKNLSRAFYHYHIAFPNRLYLK